MTAAAAQAAGRTRRLTSVPLVVPQLARARGSSPSLPGLAFALVSLLAPMLVQPEPVVFGSHAKHRSAAVGAALLGATDSARVRHASAALRTDALAARAEVAPALVVSHDGLPLSLRRDPRLAPETPPPACAARA
jgi:hypothetical protein